VRRKSRINLVENKKYSHFYQLFYQIDLLKVVTNMLKETLTVSIEKDNGLWNKFNNLNF
jgi:hypothetical protein